MTGTENFCFRIGSGVGLWCDGPAAAGFRKGENIMESKYIQLYNRLLEQIENKKLQEGDKLPSEKELMEKYELSRVTVRQAMANLVQSGYARARRGIGTDVVYEKVEEQMEGVISFTEEMKKHHIEMQTIYCKMELISPGETVARSLQIPLTEPCYCLKRVRNAVGKPMVYTITYLKKICELPTEPNPIWNRCISICGRNMESILNPAGIRLRRHFHRKRCRKH